MHPYTQELQVVCIAANSHMIVNHDDRSLDPQQRWQSKTPLGFDPSGVFLLLPIAYSLSLKTVVVPIRQNARLFWRPQPHNAINRIRRTLLRRMEVPHLELAQ